MSDAVSFTVPILGYSLLVFIHSPHILDEVINCGFGILEYILDTIYPSTKYESQSTWNYWEF